MQNQGFTTVLTGVQPVAEKNSAGSTKDYQTFLELQLGYHFNNRLLLKIALTTPSFRSIRGQEHVEDNQRLELLGDAVLGMIATEFLFATYPDEDEGALTIRRSQIVSTTALAEFARTLNLAEVLRTCQQVTESGAGGISDRVLADALEAVFGALWLDGGLTAVRTAFHRIIELNPMEPLQQWEFNPKGELQNLVQAEGKISNPLYEVIAVEGVAHDPYYTVRVTLENGRSAIGSGRTKRAAESAAATTLLTELKNS